MVRIKKKNGNDTNDMALNKIEKPSDTAAAVAAKWGVKHLMSRIDRTDKRRAKSSKRF